jgi:hypothetical protein
METSVITAGKMDVEDEVVLLVWRGEGDVDAVEELDLDPEEDEEAQRKHRERRR